MVATVQIVAQEESESSPQPGPQKELPEDREGKEPGTATERHPIAPEPPAGADAPDDR